MTASNSRGFSWTEEKYNIILDIMTHLLISNKLDPLADGTIEMVLSKIVEFKDFKMFRGIPLEEVRQVMMQHLNHQLVLTGITTWMTLCPQTMAPNT